MTDFINKLRDALSDALYTARCPYCSKVIKRNEFACNSCKKDFPQNISVRYAVGGYSCYSPFPYDDKFRNAVKNFKFGNCGAYAKPLSYAIFESIQKELDLNSFDLITCVPMHKKAKRERGYNQAELLARRFSQFCGIPYADTLEKFKENQKQHSIKASERAKNVRGVYRVIDKSLVKNKKILIIDDIITTGNTLGECARMLSMAGSGEIVCATVCAVV